MTEVVVSCLQKQNLCHIERKAHKRKREISLDLAFKGIRITYNKVNYYALDFDRIYIIRAHKESI